MATVPLTHHDIIRYAAPLSRSGLKINLGKCDRAARYIEFKPTPSDHSAIEIIMAMEVGANNKINLTRVVMHQHGLVSTLNAVLSDLSQGLDTFAQIPVSRQLHQSGKATIARSYTLLPHRSGNAHSAKLSLRFACAQIMGVEIRVDVSTGGSMPADVRVLKLGHPGSYMRETLADGGDVPLHHRAARTTVLNASNNAPEISVNKLPQDLLAVLGPQWRPLVDQGDHWKTLMRLLGKDEKRLLTSERYFEEAVTHLETTLSRPPLNYHATHEKARWRVYVRRLQPAMVFLGIMALMPISWFLVKDGGLRLHPLALGLTPMLMVAVVALTTREIPIMEIPPRPGPLNEHHWNVPDITKPASGKSSENTFSDKDNT